MDTQRLLHELLDLADRLGIEIRRVPLGGEGGGLCQLRGRSVLFVDTTAGQPDQLGRTAQALASLPDIEQSYLPPQVRDLLDTYKDQT